MTTQSQVPQAVPNTLTDQRKSLRFLKKLYSFHHVQRFEWLRKKIASLEKQNVAVLELGCADARSLEYVPAHVDRYLGFDAGWRSGWQNGKACGLEAARERYGRRNNFRFVQSVSYTDIQRVPERFDLGIVMETFEYLDTQQLESYIATLAEKIEVSGCVLATMPNEKGFPLLVKAIGSKLSGVRRSEYTFSQFLNALAGRLDRVPRAERGRKGFDYGQIAALAARHFRYVHLEAVGSPGLPTFLSPNIGLIASHQPIVWDTGNSGSKRGKNSRDNPMKHSCILATCITLLSIAFVFAPSSAAQQSNQQQTQRQNQQQNQHRDEIENSLQDLQQKDVTTFRGKISQKYSVFYLEVSTTHNSYKLDDSRKARLYLGKTVRVTGTLDEEKNLIRVKEISSVG
jgi:Protein of unknown function (DUF5818)